MRHFRFVVVGLSTIFCLVSLSSFAQLEAIFAPFDCREHAEWFQEEPVVELPAIDSSLIVADVEVPIGMDTINGWKQWSLVQNFSFGKDRGELSMINDLDALHPFFRDKIRALIAECKAKGINLAVVETYRTHAKQNEYRFMGRKYTNSTGGKSKHQYGLAVDLVPIVDSAAVWDNIVLWRKIGVVGEKLGLRWGGRWKKPYDPGHFEWTGGLTSTHLSVGKLPEIPLDRYPCIDDDLRVLRKFWKEWEVTQSGATTSKIPSAKNSSVRN
jgi:peptidoglycan L-alanyl-D-glutamate endopeptidase CwlK